MHALTDSALVALWEKGRSRNRLGRALLLAAASPEADGRVPEELSIGERDLAILYLRNATSGVRLHGEANCPHCAEHLEFNFDCADLAAQLSRPTSRHFTLGGIRFRLPNSADLAAAASAGDAAEAGRRVLRRCCLDAEEHIEWTDVLLDDADRRIGELDEAADIRIALECAACSKVWNERLDIAAFFWDEIDLRARRLLDEVHQLALAYGWGEEQVFALSDARRRAYLERCCA
jgi:hypothetical protein